MRAISILFSLIFINFVYGVASNSATSPSKNCTFQVPNCSFCPLTAPPFNLEVGVISCVFFRGAWTWTFTPSAGNMENNGSLSMGINSNAVIEGNMNNKGEMDLFSGSVVYIMGDFVQGPSSVLGFCLDGTFFTKRTPAAPMTVEGSVSMQGNIIVTLQAQPKQGTTNLTLISLNSTQQATVSSLITVVPMYNKSSCDTITYELLNQPGTLGFTMSTSIGNKCGKNLGLIIGLAIGIPVGSAVVITLLILFFTKRAAKKARLRVKEVNMRMENLRNPVD